MNGFENNDQWLKLINNSKKYAYTKACGKKFLPASINYSVIFRL